MIQALPNAPILMAEDDPDDRFLAKKAMEKNQILNPFVSVADGGELIDYLYRRGKYSELDQEPFPCFILLDLNMPRMNGQEALRIIKKDEKLRRIPVVVMTTSKSLEDILGCYDMGANSYIVKPPDFEGLVKIIQALKTYWLEIVELPSGRDFTGHG